VAREPKYSDGTCPSAALSNTDPHKMSRTRTQAAAVGNRHVSTLIGHRSLRASVQQNRSMLIIIISRVWNFTIN
jgi:hypothetical protein